MVKFNIKNSSFTNVGTLFSAPGGSKLRAYMECAACGKHHEYGADEAAQCPACGSRSGRNMTIGDQGTPAWWDESKRAAAQKGN